MSLAADGSEDSKEQILTLTELGLTTTQARIYLALAKSNNLTAQKIAGISSVSRPDVYRVLNQLQETGLVEKLISKPERFQAISIEECVSRLLQRRIRKTEDLQSRGLKLVQSVKKTEVCRASSDSPACEFVFIPSKGTAYARSERMLKSTQKSIYFVGLTKRMSSWLSQYTATMEEALARNVDCRMIMPNSSKTTKPGAALKTLQKYPNFKIRTINGLPKASFSIWDLKEILIITSSNDVPFPSGTLWSSNRSLIDLCADYFELLWQKAE